MIQLTTEAPDDDDDSDSDSATVAVSIVAGLIGCVLFLLVIVTLCIYYW